MKQLIAWIIMALAALGSLYAIGLIIVYLIIGKDPSETDDCTCPVCKELYK